MEERGGFVVDAWWSVPNEATRALQGRVIPSCGHPTADMVMMTMNTETTEQWPIFFFLTNILSILIYVSLRS